MIKEFEGKSEQEAIDKAIADLNLDREEFDVEIVESSRRSLFRKGPVKIRVHITEEDEEDDETVQLPAEGQEEELISFLETLMSKMGFPGTVTVAGREARKTIVRIDSDHSGILIGRKGKNLDALQVLVNVFAGKLGFPNRVVVDTENYRSRREENLVRMARKTADQVRRSRDSRLLEPMNPFERRIIHTTLNGLEDIETKSEGEGLFKQVRIIYRG
ncbi:RNA-binding cell elongation regulator Jag/EloR [Marispirochaeta aestuarii]|uniref:RNA-binding protein KhpB n=1 Tax=Marispirochaeta aestuarii TaxID=1963862 RepID=A0A1Y1RWM5_9SPIO|nr:RNA-binding cell elongation regulator Jag/EloR [Marispirochaeta aestuarii]ORC34616.1 protein jag [Marispirochaeta aestuarii]